MHISPRKYAATLTYAATLAALVAMPGCQSGTSTFAWKTPDLQAWKFWDRNKPSEAQLATQPPMVQHQPMLPSQAATPTTMTNPAYANVAASPYAPGTPGAYPATNYPAQNYPTAQPPMTGGSPATMPGQSAAAYAAPRQTAGAYPMSYPATSQSAASAPVQSGYYNPNYAQTAGGNSAAPATRYPAAPTGYATAPAYPKTTTPAASNSQPSPQAAPAAGGYAPTAYPQTADARNRMSAGGQASQPAAGSGSRYATPGDQRSTAPSPYNTGSPYDRASQPQARGGAGASYDDHAPAAPAGRYGNMQPSAAEPRYTADARNRYTATPPQYESGPSRYPAATSPAPSVPAAGTYRPGGTGDYILPGKNQINSTQAPATRPAPGSPVAPASYTAPAEPATRPAPAELSPPAVYTPPSADEGTS